MIQTIYGDCTESNGVIRLAASRDTPDGIGCALCFREWDGEVLKLAVERVECWRSEPWADLWFMARMQSRYNANLPYPMRYARFTPAMCEVGESGGPDPQDQRIHATVARALPAVGRTDTYHVSWARGALHIDGGWSTLSLTAPVCELGLYCEGSVLEVAAKCR